ncbi:hypothetical protein PoB_006328700 [Plakobranchus ocellatus]|uniref:Vesicular, overexpressed in cancer, prosurvival protein 1 n=1 Tax=Plakobranchus ocellatus TaxID=259542 RepID=A0AAV4CXZ4_9GAST|nr:hypothetical protein PoB_006328700 [Plakobranchus ocellatus]
MEVLCLFLLQIALVLIFSGFANASEVCVYGDRYKICDHGCCSSDCCMSPYQIAGIVFGAIAFICLIAAVVLYCVKRQKRKGRVISNGTPRVMMVNGYSQPMAFTTTQPFAPGYASSYGHPGIPPPYSANATMPPNYSYGGFPAQPPPPAYSQTDSAKNPFAIAAAQAAASPQAHGSGASNPGTT